MGCRATMPSLEQRKASFLLCLGICVLFFSVIYIWSNMPVAPKLIEPTNCRPFTTECGAFLPKTGAGMEWRRRDCQKDTFILNSGLQCSALRKALHFITRPLSHTEEKYPLAFILTVHKELELFVRLLRAIYMPHNVYCIHIDAKAPLEYQEAIRKLVSCFPNVFISSLRETVTYAGFSRLQADLNCMEDLVRSKVLWKKVINLCGQDFPIKTNLELVQYLGSEQWRERNMTPGVKQPPSMRRRTEFQHQEVIGSHVKGLWWKKTLPPHNMQIYFGTAYYALKREFVDFVLRSPKAKDLLEWSRDTYSPDEHYWVTLNNLKEAPGSYVNGGWDGEVRAIKWRDQEGKVHNGCQGHYVHDICIYGAKDLPWIMNKNSMFANKFESETSPETLDCLEQWHRNKVLQGAMVPIRKSWLLATAENITENYKHRFVSHKVLRPI